MSLDLALNCESNTTNLHHVIFNMGAGLHGINGVAPRVAFHMLEIYILPFLLHGLEVLLPTDKQIQLLGKLYEDTMLRILGLQTNVAKPAPYILLDALPLQAIIEHKALSLLGSVLHDKHSIEAEIMERQVLLKPYSERSKLVLKHQDHTGKI